MKAQPNDRASKTTTKSGENNIDASSPGDGVEKQKLPTSRSEKGKQSWRDKGALKQSKTLKSNRSGLRSANSTTRVGTPNRIHPVGAHK